jgi:hypothetical protein
MEEFQLVVLNRFGFASATANEGTVTYITLSSDYSLESERTEEPSAQCFPSNPRKLQIYCPTVDTSEHSGPPAFDHRLHRFENGRTCERSWPFAHRGA